MSDNKVRSKISAALLVVLVVALAVIVYDKYMLPNSRNRAAQDLSELLQSSDDFSQAKVDGLMGREGTPTEETKDNKYLRWVKYTWGGLMNKHDLYVRFKKRDDVWVATETSVEKPDDSPIANTDMTRPSDEEVAAENRQHGETITSQAAPENTSNENNQSTEGSSGNDDSGEDF